MQLLLSCSAAPVRSYSLNTSCLLPCLTCSAPTLSFLNLISNYSAQLLPVCLSWSHSAWAYSFVSWSNFATDYSPCPLNNWLFGLFTAIIPKWRLRVAHGTERFFSRQFTPGRLAQWLKCVWSDGISELLHSAKLTGHPSTLFSSPSMARKCPGEVPMQGKILVAIFCF